MDIRALSSHFDAARFAFDEALTQPIIAECPRGNHQP